jgi:hypothetical protein
MIASLWIDRDAALIVKRTELGMEVQQIGAVSGLHVQNSELNATPEKDVLSDVDEAGRGTNRLGKQLRNYYDAIIAVVRNAESILIFGPGPAKTELKHRIRELNIDVAHIVC